MSKKIPTGAKWQQEKAALKAIQWAFDVSDQVQYVVRREALELGLQPSDRIRQILGLAVHSKAKRPRLTLSLKDEDFIQLAQRYGLALEDRKAIRQQASQELIEHAAEQTQSSQSPNSAKLTANHRTTDNATHSHKNNPTNRSTKGA